MNNPAPALPGSGNRMLLIIGTVIVGLVVLTVAVVLVAGSRKPVAYPADTPEGAFQAYLTAFDEGDVEGAYGHFSAGVQERMDLDAYEAAIDAQAGYYGPQSSRRVLFDRRSGEGDRITLHLVVEEFYGDGLEGSTNRSPREIRLVHEDGAWRIDEPLVWVDPAPLEPPTFR